MIAHIGSTSESSLIPYRRTPSSLEVWQGLVISIIVQRRGGNDDGSQVIDGLINLWCLEEAS